MLTWETFTSGFAGLAELYSREPTEPLMMIYYHAVRDLEDPQFKAGITHVVRHRKFSSLPMPAELREAVLGDPDIQAGLALAQVEKVMREVGAYQSVLFEDPVIGAVIQSFDGGWPGICQLHGDEWKFVRKDFLQRYKGLMYRYFDKPQKLAGIIEHQNQAKGFLDRISEPVRIGKRILSLPGTEGSRS